MFDCCCLFRDCKQQLLIRFESFLFPSIFQIFHAGNRDLKTISSFTIATQPISIWDQFVTSLARAVLNLRETLQLNARRLVKDIHRLVVGHGIVTFQNHIATVSTETETNKQLYKVSSFHFAIVSIYHKNVALFSLIFFS